MNQYKFIKTLPPPPPQKKTPENLIEKKIPLFSMKYMGEGDKLTPF